MRATEPPGEGATTRPAWPGTADVAYRVRNGLLDVAANDGTALLVTSHNMREVERLCERVVFLAAGKVVADGSPTEVADAFGHGDLEGVFLHLAGTVVSEDEIPDLGVALDEEVPS